MYSTATAITRQRWQRSFSMVTNQPLLDDVNGVTVIRDSSQHRRNTHSYY